MNSKKVLTIGSLCVVGFSNFNILSQASFLKTKNPNIIIILADDLGWGDVGYHGSAIKTPNIDKLAEEGVQLSRFYVAPISSPTRAGLLTGIYPNRFGIRENVIPPWRDFGLDPSNTLIPEFLANNGYKNRAILGKWHLGHSRPEYYPMNNGFTHFYGHLNGAIDYFSHEREGELDWHNDYDSNYDEGYSTDLISEEAVNCIRKYNEEDTPFFLYIPYNAPHTPFQAKDEDINLYLKNDSLGSNNSNRKQVYAGMVTALDRGIGNILSTLKELNIENNTLVLFFSDNGGDVGSGGGSSGPLRGHKFQEFEGGVLSPCIIKWPARIDGKRTVDQLTGYIDIFPTICEIINPDKKTTIPFDGISILKVLEEKQDNINRDFYLGRGALIANEWKIILAGNNPNMKLTDDVLFNLKNDPFEKTDLSNERVEIKEKLMEVVKKYDSIKPDKILPPHNDGKENFIPPKEWNIFLSK